MSGDQAVALFKSRFPTMVGEMWAWWNDSINEYEIHYVGSNEIIGYVKPSNHSARKAV
jgi:hypothetical protein